MCFHLAVVFLTNFSCPSVWLTWPFTAEVYDVWARKTSPPPPKKTKKTFFSSALNYMYIGFYHSEYWTYIANENYMFAISIKLWGVEGVPKRNVHRYDVTVNLKNAFTMWANTNLANLCRFGSFVWLQGTFLLSDAIVGKWAESWRYCNTRPTRDKVGASSWPLSPDKNQFNIEGITWIPYQILSW